MDGATQSVAAKKDQRSVDRQAHQNVMRKLVVEGGWVQKGLCDSGWWDEEKCGGCNKEEGTERHRLCHVSVLERRQKPDPRGTGDMGAKGINVEGRLDMQGITSHPLSGSNWRRRHSTVRRCESEKHRSWGLPVEGFWDHVATDGSLVGGFGWRACGWSVVQLDHDKGVGAMHGMDGTLDAELEVQRSICKG